MSNMLKQHVPWEAIEDASSRLVGEKWKGTNDSFENGVLALFNVLQQKRVSAVEMTLWQRLCYDMDRDQSACPKCGQPLGCEVSTGGSYTGYTRFFCWKREGGCGWSKRRPKRRSPDD